MRGNNGGQIRKLFRNWELFMIAPAPAHTLQFRFWIHVMHNIVRVHIACMLGRRLSRMVISIPFHLGKQVSLEYFIANQGPAGRRHL